MDATEEEGKSIVMNILKQNITKRPDLVAKVNEQYFIGEAKWIGQSGGNQAKSVSEVIDFCKNQRGVVRRIGIIDGYPWATYNVKGKIINDKVCVITQESENDIMSVLLLKKYLESFL